MHGQQKQKAHTHLETATLAGVLASAISAFTIAPAQAGTAVVITDGTESVFEYNDTMLRVGSSGNPGYAVVRDGSIYTVMNQGGNTIVIDAGSMMRGFSEMNTQIAPSDFDAKVVSLKKTNRVETIAGIIGDVYEVTLKDEDGTESTEEIVLSRDKRAREFRDAMFLMMDIAADATSQEAKDHGADIKARLDQLNVGVLRFGNDMRVSKIDDKVVDSTRFDLPAPPMNLEGLGSMLGAMGQQGNVTSANETATAAADTASEEAEATAAGSEKKGGLFSSVMGALGGKADRQADRAGQSVENKVDQETDEAVDKGIGKFVDKIFGN